MNTSQVIEERLVPAAGDLRRCGDPEEMRSPGPLTVQSACWSRDAAQTGDELELTAGLDGTDVIGIAFRVSNARGQPIALLPALVSGTQARAKWRVPVFGSGSEQYDFGVWQNGRRLGGSERLFVGASQELDGVRPAPRLQVVECEKPAARRHVHVGRVRAIPSRALEGDIVKLRAFILGASEGESVVFRIFRGAAKEPYAVVEGKVAGEAAVSEWKVEGVEGGGCEQGLDFVDFDLEAEIPGAGARAHCLCELRGYRSPQLPSSCW